MRRLALFTIISATVGMAWVLPATASAATFTQCPPVDKDAGCGFLITVTNSGVSIAQDAEEGPYDGSDDTLVGIVDDSSRAVSQITLSSENEIFGFDGDGMCDAPEPPRAPGCIVLAENKSHETPAVKPGTECATSPLDGITENDVEEPCGHEPPPGEPANIDPFEGGDGEPVGYAKNGDAVAGYEGPRNWYSNVGVGATSGVVDFGPALQPGESTYFALESSLTATSLVFGSTDTVSSTLSGGGQSGSSITVLQGTSVTDTAMLVGANAAQASGEVTYDVYNNSTCSGTPVATSAGTVSAGTANPSAAETTLGPGIYYWTASYGGDVNNQKAASACGSELLTVVAPSSTSTIETGGGVSSASLPVLVGTPVTDQAHIAGSEAASATGTVTYTLYSDSKCTKPVSSSVEPVTGGVASPSTSVAETKTGTYYWTASYSGGGLDAASSSACGSETLIVSKHANLGLPSGTQCHSHRDFAVHPRFPKGAKIVRFEEFINGTLVKSGHLKRGATSVDLIGLPKGTYHVELVTFEASGASYEDTRTYHTCVPKKHKHGKHK